MPSCFYRGLAHILLLHVQDLENNHYLATIAAIARLESSRPLAFVGVGNQMEDETAAANDAMDSLSQMAQSSTVPRAKAVTDAIASIAQNTARLDLMPPFKLMREHADTLDENARRAIYEDTAVFSQEWNQYLRSDGPSRTLSGFMSSKALGATQKAHRDGVALLTVHSSKGLEFDAVFVAGMAEGTFPDYRAVGRTKEMAEESCNAFVAVTRSKRLLYLTYPRIKLMPWGDYRAQQASRFISKSGIG